jgi:hypothetical protein
MKLRSLHYLSLAVAALMFIAGCGEGPIKTVPVYGTVTFLDRQPPDTCDLIFQPLKVDGGLLRPSLTERQADGSYRVKAFKNSKGLIPGTYHIQLLAHDLKPGADPKSDANWKLNKYDGGEVKVDPDSSGVEHNIEVRTKG